MTDEIQPVVPPGYMDAITEMWAREMEKMMAWTRRDNEGWRQDYYGAVPFPQEKKVDDDPFEMLLGICRVLGLRYEIKEGLGGLGLQGPWQATLTTTDNWPADFFGGLHPKNRGKRTYTVLGSATPLDALRGAFYQAMQDLRRNCEMWRNIVRQQVYPEWFEERGPVLEMFDVLKNGTGSGNGSSRGSGRSRGGTGYFEPDAGHKGAAMGDEASPRLGETNG